jgi:hypothetical protein
MAARLGTEEEAMERSGLDLVQVLNGFTDA